VSELRRLRPDPGVEAWLEDTPTAATYLSVLVLGEVRQGVERLRRRDGTQAAVLEEWLVAMEAGFADRILSVDGVVAQAWGRLSASSQLPVVDGLLAATALVHGLVVVTRDTRPFERIGVSWLNPWDA
jgi:predicted nucleic acid-binding protein